MNKHIIWAIVLFLITFMICSTVIWLNYNSWTLRFEMDDNTKEAIESIEFDEIGEKEIIFRDRCFQRILLYEMYIDYDENMFRQEYESNTTWHETECGEYEAYDYSYNWSFDEDLPSSEEVRK